ncbi:MAG TPA: hypothetical protein VN703_07840 [Candidatus Sulfopaludibacter sp.]|nr:hypothetical protein [Candidatus Sulfopaludibacter sp.]
MEDASIKVPICILIDPKEVKLIPSENGPTYKGSFYTYKTNIDLGGYGQHHEIIEADKNKLITNSFYDRGSTKNVDRTYYRLIRESYDYIENL